MLSPAALPSTIRARIASACGMLCVRNHASNCARSAAPISTAHLFTPRARNNRSPLSDEFECREAVTMRPILLKEIGGRDVAERLKQSDLSHIVAYDRVHQVAAGSLKRSLCV